MKKPKDIKQVLLTFDYELFMGSRSGTVENCLLKPTEEILHVLKMNAAKAVFFVDTTFLLLAKETSEQAYLLIKKQIQHMCLAGHQVELHIHPQWLNAYKLNENEWGFSSQMKYRLDLFEEKEIEKLFVDSWGLLQSILSEVDPNYKISSFRAGGWCLPSFRILKSIFTKLGLIYDSSVLPGAKIDNGIYQKYDYSKSPRAKWCWRFSDDVQAESNGEFIEIPCAVEQFGLLDLVNNRRKMRSQKIYGDGQGAAINEARWGKFLRLLSNPKKPLTLDGYNGDLLAKMIAKSSMEVVTLVGHPKSFGPINVKALETITQTYKTILFTDVKV